METHFPNTNDGKSRIARERIMADLKALADDTEVLLRATAEDLSHKAQDARARVTAALEKAKATYGSLQTQGVESAKAAAKKADATIRAHPYESLGVAFGIGMLIGVLLRRK